jgi:hypothetical protein
MSDIDHRIRKLELQLKERIVGEEHFGDIAMRPGISLTKVDELREAIRELPSLELLKLAEMPLNTAPLHDLS